ncbi:MAG: hypothetical protein WAU07_04600 [Microgenomates group bacterium]
MIATLFSFGVGLLVLLASSHAFLHLSKQVAARWKFSPLFVSLVIVALGTNLPELTVTIAAIARNDSGLAIGNLLGSSIANITLILGLATLFGSVRIGTTKTPKNAALLLAATLVFCGLLISNISAFLSAVILVAILGLGLTYQYILAKNGRLHEDKKLLKLLDTFEKKQKKLPASLFILALFASIAGLGVGGYVSVQAVSRLAELLGLTTTFLGFTLTAISTSLPELLTVLLASNAKDAKVVFGTLIGSNLFNATLFPAIIMVYQGMPYVDLHSMGALVVCTVILAAIVNFHQGESVPKSVSVGLIILYCAITLFTYQAISS